MIKLIGDNNVLEAINLMNASVDMNKYETKERNEAAWINYFLDLVYKQKESPHFLVIGDYIDGKLRGFLSACSYTDYYNLEYIMDVKDCILDHTIKNNAFTVYRLFDYMIDHIKKNGGKSWRADSIRPEEEGQAYAKFLAKRYNTKTHVSVRGVIQENKDE